MNSFADFNNYRHRVLTTAAGKIYSLPINLKTINQFYNLNLPPNEAAAFLKSKTSVIPNPANLEEMAISLIGLLHNKTMGLRSTETSRRGYCQASGENFRKRHIL